MGWRPKGELLFPEEVYDNLAWHTPDVRRGVDFLNQFVTFWMDDVAAAQNEPGGEEHEHTPWSPDRTLRARREEGVGRSMLRRRTGPTFEEFFNNGEGGWGALAVPDIQVNASGPTGKRKEDSNTEGWVIQKAARGRGRGRGKGNGRGRRQRNPNRKEENQKVGSDNIFAQLRVDDEE
ncbi:hypothetical protein P691DRAFT_800073 [Macrolepiota fuliginosa MF-IS2]|uniref:Uncharacterized protein n=1 Tax=Macrolepiota fuliginosa MF-IS2 TaxID=1400762 RepID=A0A9P5XST0_9AGAR|nr:hypothetical protein P691DRAFT_800073 [Macrolepiota fuliginosa MF-IS2]